MDSIEVQQMKAQAKEEKARKKVSTLFCSNGAMRVTHQTRCTPCIHQETRVIIV